MPGPCSAPNGNYSLTTMVRGKGDIVKSGKTAKKRGEIMKPSAEHKKLKLSAARRRELEAE